MEVAYNGNMDPDAAFEEMLRLSRIEAERIEQIEAATREAEKRSLELAEIARKKAAAAARAARLAEIEEEERSLKDVIRRSLEEEQLQRALKLSAEDCVDIPENIQPENTVEIASTAQNVAERFLRTCASVRVKRLFTTYVVKTALENGGAAFAQSTLVEMFSRSRILATSDVRYIDCGSTTDYNGVVFQNKCAFVALSAGLQSLPKGYRRFDANSLIDLIAEYDYRNNTRFSMDHFHTLSRFVGVNIAVMEPLLKSFNYYGDENVNKPLIELALIHGHYYLVGESGDTIYQIMVGE